MIPSQNQNDAFHRQSDDCEVATINHESRVRVTRGDRLRIFWFADGTRSVPATFGVFADGTRSVAATFGIFADGTRSVPATFGIFADGTRSVPATLFSLAILLCGFYNTATAQNDKAQEDKAPADNKKTILLKDAGVIQKADEAPKMQAVRPALRIPLDINNPNPNLDFLKPLINVELSFVKRVCDPTDEQMAAIVVAAKEAHQGMTNLIIGQPQAVNFLGGHPEMFMGPNNQRMSVNPFKRIREDVAKLLKPIVSEQQYSQYIEESKSRDKFERDTVVEALLDMLDAKLVLSHDQQTQLYEKLNAHDTLLDLHSLAVYRSNAQYLPQLPEQLIVPILTASQKQVFSSLNRVTIHQSIGQGNPTGFEEDWLK